MPQSKRIRKLKELEKHRGIPLKVSYDRGKTWEYIKLDPLRSAQYFSNGAWGYPGPAEISERGVHSQRAITDYDFQNPNFRVMTATAEEVVGKKWSYEK